MECAYNPTCQKRNGVAFDGKRLLGMNKDLKTMTNELQRLSQESGYSVDELLERVPNGFAVRTKKSRAEVDYIIKHDYTLHFFRMRDFMECEDVSKQFNIVFVEGDGDLVLADVVYANIMIKGKW